MTSAKLLEAHPVFMVRDVTKALAFYTKKLSFTLTFKDADVPNYAGIRRDGVEIHLQWHDESDFPDEGMDGQMLRIKVDNPDALYDELAPAGAIPDTKTVQDTPWGTREIGFFDPDGNGLVFYRDL